MKALATKFSSFLLFILFISLASFAQDAKVNAKIDASQVMVGDQARLFIEVQHNAKQSRIEWAAMPDTFNSLEIVEKGKIDTVRQGDAVTYKQRLLITGFDSGAYTVPSFIFPVIPANGTPYTIQTDSFPLLVQTVAVDTSKGYKDIKGIITVKSTWKDYIWYIAGALIFIVLLAVIIIYFVRNKKVVAPVVSKAPPETLQEKAIRMLNALEQKQLWQSGQVKAYYVELTDILRNYIEARFRTPALELTTDELLQSARTHKELNAYRELLGGILYTADLAKFAKAEPLPAEHMAAMDNAKQFIISSKPVVTENTQQPS